MRYLACLALLAGCGAGPTVIDGPEQATRIVLDGNTLTLTLRVSRTVLRYGQADTIRATLTNAGPGEAQLNFSSSCQILPYIRGANTALVFPEGGGWGCYQALTTLVVPANQSVTREWVWTGVTRFPTPTPLPPGTYYVIVSLQARNAAMQTSPVPIQLTD